MLDPASSHGVLRAVMSGMLAAHLAAVAIADPRREARVATTYHTWFTDWFLHDMRTLGQAYKRAGLFVHAAALGTAERRQR